TLRSVPIRNVTVTVSLPSPVDWLLIYSMFSTPLICCSSGVATVLETVSADAPGYVVVIWTVGGTISGYCATGRMASARSPISVSKTLRTVAKIGRSIKLCERRTAELRFQDCFSLGRTVAIGGRVIADRAVFGRDLGARTGSDPNHHNGP